MTPTQKREAKRKRQIWRLFKKQGGKCFWCGCEMLPPGAPSEQGIPDPPNRCTSDHLDCKLSGERGKHDGELRRVAACNKCNSHRNPVRMPSNWRMSA